MNQETKSPTQELQERIAAHRQAQTRRRARAFIDCHDRVMGMAVQPITLRTWTMLHATQSRFLEPSEIPLEGDVRNFLWFHSRLFTMGRFARVFKWFALLPFTARLKLQDDVHYYSAVLARAIDDIRGIINDSLADGAKGGSKNDCMSAACIEAQFIHLFSEKYGWSPAYIRSIPLARLFQFSRSMSHGDDEDAVEQAIKFDHMRRRNQELAKQREAAKAAAATNNLNTAEAAI